MRFSLAPLLCLLLAACPAPKPPGASPMASPESTASPTPTATESASPAAGESPSAPAITDGAGVWATTDPQGQPFEIAIFPNGQVVTNWTKGKNGAYGQRGFWRKEGGKLVIFYQDGTSGRMEESPEGIRLISYAGSLDSPPERSAVARLLPPGEARFLGVWRLNKEPDGTYQYLALQSNGRAFSSVNGGTEGKWTISKDMAECTWPDGWVDRLELTPDGWQKRSTIGTEADSPADLSSATRVGEAPFEIAP